MAAVPPVDQWADWSYAESESEEEISPDELLKLRVEAILRASLIDLAKNNPDGKT